MYDKRREPIIRRPLSSYKEEIPIKPESESVTLDSTAGDIIGIVANCEYLNVRKEPNGEVLSFIPAGTTLTIIDETSDPEWYRVKLDDGFTEGFCMKAYIKKD